MSDQVVRVLVAGLGNMGRSHAIAYHYNPGFEIVGLVNRSAVELPEELSTYPIYNEFYTALNHFIDDTAVKSGPYLVSINTYSDSHAEYAIAAMEKGAHVFLEKPIATSVADAKLVVRQASALNRKLVVGYILRHHPSWVRLIQEARALGGPFVFRLNLNQQSSGSTWDTHKQLMESTSPIVDCGVHYVDVMCQITDAKPVKVNGMGLRLSPEIDPRMYNYGQFQVHFDDDSVGWYEAGWGPMMSESAFFVKDIISPNGSVSIVMDENARSDDMNTHTRTAKIRVHYAERNAEGQFSKPDLELLMDEEPNHQSLCNNEQTFVLNAIRKDLDLHRHMQDAVQSLSICLAADSSILSGRTVVL